MRIIDVDEAKKQISQMQTLKASERNLFRLALDRTPTYEPPNDPLTLRQLREMDGEPVCITPAGGGKYVWMLVDEKYEVCRDAYGCLVVFENLGKTWLAYRQRPENGGRE